MKHTEGSVSLLHPCSSNTLPGAPHSLETCCFWLHSRTHVTHYVGDVSQGFLSEATEFPFLTRTFQVISTPKVNLWVRS